MHNFDRENVRREEKACEPSKITLKFSVTFLATCFCFHHQRRRRFAYILLKITLLRDLRRFFHDLHL